MGKRKIHGVTYYQCDCTGLPMRTSYCYAPTVGKTRWAHGWGSTRIAKPTGRCWGCVRGPWRRAPGGPTPSGPERTAIEHTWSGVLGANALSGKTYRSRRCLEDKVAFGRVALSRSLTRHNILKRVNACARLFSTCQAIQLPSVQTPKLVAASAAQLSKVLCEAQWFSA